MEKLHQAGRAAPARWRTLRPHPQQLRHEPAQVLHRAGVAVNMQIRLDLAHHGLLAWVGAAEQHALRGQLRGLGTYQSGCLQGSCDHRLANVISHLGQQVHVCCLQQLLQQCHRLRPP
eukprot:CAMPEP_0202383254 /NCGR_PEP_ID=MMETSP1127-20130417/48126_1 /ASSEMBLY_ACC=CAM_ASM_000462 /TAXON_ID=3047 /ORGANISM="Dunaliella tertiolecta, Strain CCMP1320" /LENGTH=117 /DNA_ID=CAMNT_0048982697 /DNA_START=918 /DNA_END=1267 /DNA_ORIENTATION=+